MTTTLLQITSGTGPLEARAFVALLGRRLAAECRHRGLRVVGQVTRGPENAPRSVGLLLETAPGLLSDLVGTHSWRQKSPRRGGRSRTRWFAGVSLQPAPEPEVRVTALPERDLAPADAVSKIRRDIESGGMSIPRLRWAVPCLDALSPSHESMARCTELTRAIQVESEYGLWAHVEHLDPNEIDGNGASPIDMAILHPIQPTLLEELLKAGADPNAPDGNGVFPLEVAIGRQNKPKFKALRKAKVDAQRRLEGGRTYAHLAAERVCTGAFIELKKLKLDLNAPDDAGRTPLHYGVFNYCTNELLKARVDPNLKDANGISPLELAARGALSHRLTSFSAEGTAKGKPAKYLLEDNMIKVRVGNRKPRKLKWEDESRLARKHCPPHRTFMKFAHACVLMCKSADIEQLTVEGVPVKQLLADICRPELDKVLSKRGLTLPPPRTEIPAYDRPVPPEAVQLL